MSKVIMEPVGPRKRRTTLNEMDSRFHDEQAPVLCQNKDYYLIFPDCEYMPSLYI